MSNTTQQSRYDWSKTPIDAQYAATDEDGAVNAFKSEPLKTRDVYGWFWEHTDGLMWRIPSKKQHTPDWESSLKRRPQTQTT